MQTSAESTVDVTTYRIIYGDTDQMGVAYYANYLRWFEIGRTEFLRRRGAPYASIEKRGLRFPVSEVSCRYLRPARYDDTITIETRITSLGRASLNFAYRVLKDGIYLAGGWTKHACVDDSGRIVKIPPELTDLLKAAVSPAGHRPQR